MHIVTERLSGMRSNAALRLAVGLELQFRFSNPKWICIVGLTKTAESGPTAADP